MLRTISTKLVNPGVREIRRFFSNESALSKALNIKFAWSKIVSSNEPHSFQGTAALKRLITDEVGECVKNTSIKSLPKGKTFVGFFPGPGVAEHALVFDRVPESSFFESDILPNITKSNSTLKTVELSSDVESCLSEKIDGSSNAYLIHFGFLRKPSPTIEKVIEEKSSNSFSN